MPTLVHLIRLMGYASLSRSFKLGPEDSEAIRFVNELRGLVMEGRLKAVFTHPANELAGLVRVGKDGKRRALPQVALARALGLITGSSDYLFLWAGGSCAIEFKSATGGLTIPQRDFRTWCEDQDVPYHVVRSASQGIDILKQHERIVP